MTNAVRALSVPRSRRPSLPRKLKAGVSGSSSARGMTIIGGDRYDREKERAAREREALTAKWARIEEEREAEEATLSRLAQQAGEPGAVLYEGGVRV